MDNNDCVKTEMDVLFENHCENKTQALKELCVYLHFKTPWRIGVFVVFGTMLAFLVAFYAFVIKGFHTRMLIPIAWSVLYALYVFFGYRTALKNTLQREKETERMRKTSNVFYIMQDCVISDMEDPKERVSFDLIQKVIVTKHYVSLATKGNLHVLLQKDGFTKGTYEELCDFLRSKGYKVKG